jgi:hypothetical protein
MSFTRALTHTRTISPASTESDSAMDDDEIDSFVADSLLKLRNALPRRPGDSIEEVVSFASLMLNVASLLPNHGAHGLGDEQQRVVERAVACVQHDARAALVQPLPHASAAILDLLRSLAKGTKERDSECVNGGDIRRGGGRSTEGVFSPSTVRTHRYINYADAEEFVGGLSSAERFYEVCHAGYQRLQKLLSAEYWRAVDRVLPTLTISMAAWAVPLMFDGLRLRRGLEVAAPCGTLVDFQRAPFGLESTAATLLGDGETSVDRERVGRTAQFLMAAAEHGIRENPPDEPYYTGQGSGESEHPAHTLNNLRRHLRQDLDRCRLEIEALTLVPGKSMRIILDHMAYEAEHMPHSRGPRMFFQYALAYPCLVPKNLRGLKGYDGGLLSVWDACNHLLRLHAQEHAETLPFHALLCAVMGGVVGGLMSDTISGPFCVHPETEVFKEIALINASWPQTSNKKPCKLVMAQQHPVGRKVSATAAICDTIERGVLRPEKPRTHAIEARFDAALTMHVITSGLSRLPGVFDSRPSDGIVPLKRLYFAALHQQPGTPEGRAVEHNGCRCWKTSVFADGAPAWPPGTMPVDSIEMPWREIVGGALLSTGPLFCFSRRGFVDSLQQDWKPMALVARALDARQQAASSAGAQRQPVMPPSEAMGRLAKRAQRHVADTVTRIDNLVKTVDGPVYVTRVVEMLNAWSNLVYPTCNYSALWETSIAHFSCPVNLQKRVRSPECGGKDTSAKRQALGQG